jgi:predicted AAA+ superfamily ATPase
MTNLSNPALLPRLAASKLEAALLDTPVVLLHGPRQCGKTTLSRMVAEPKGYGYLSFDDDNLVAAALHDPIRFLSDLPPKMVLDEIQRVPQIFTAIKTIVDRDRMPGRFLLTGSANVLLLPKLSDSLAGRLEAQSLHPLSQSELKGFKPQFLDQLFNANFHVSRYSRMGERLADLMAAGGYPSALARDPLRRRAWYMAYIKTLLQRDVRDLARISSLEILPKLLKLAATQTAQLFNATVLSAPFELSRQTIGDYMTLLERVFLVDTLPPWHTREINRLVKSSKLYFVDTGLACAFLRVTPPELYQDRALFGQMLETFLIQEIKRQATVSDDDFAFHHFRDRDNHEVDLVVERGYGELAGVEMKAAASVQSSDFRGLRKLQEIAGSQFKCGVVLYDGDTILPFGEKMFAVPIQSLWQKSL